MKFSSIRGSKEEWSIGHNLTLPYKELFLEFEFIISKLQDSNFIVKDWRLNRYLQRLNRNSSGWLWSLA